MDLTGPTGPLTKSYRSPVEVVSTGLMYEQIHLILFQEV
jgi:hypothetical protein